MSGGALSDWLQQGLDRASDQPLYRQLRDLLLQAAMQGRLPAGAKMPSSRVLARELGIGRNTVTEVYETLIAEGCLHGRGGSGTYVADLAGDRMPEPEVAASVESEAPPALSQRGKLLREGAGFSPHQWGAFMPGVPDVSEFPAQVWGRLLSRAWRRPPPERMTYAPPGGLLELRAAIAAHLRDARSLNCAPEQVVITTGSHQSVDLAARMLLDPGDCVWLEDPCYWGLRSGLQSLDLDLRAAPVDGEGLNCALAEHLPPPRMVIVTPSHQYPLGSVMSLARRQTLLERARRWGAVIVEDDYDSEFRYGTRPIPCLQGLDRGGRVIYVGSFSKTLFPGLRVGYLVAPPALAEALADGSAELYREGQQITQAVLADFIREGHFGAHIRRMRGLYGSRRQILRDAIEKEFGGALQASGDNAGLHLILRLPDGADDRRIAAEILAAGLSTRPLSRYFADPHTAPSGLLLGYAGVKEEAIGPAFSRLAEVLRRHLVL
ncbi:transcriptional regulator, GntR family [Rhodoblastus acidophilus]|uniref:Transcriptional regulator, GntR family n=1 Tax=Rhodoblastus acidophilus TaxID=1074 RepID=A0A212PW26_RHOAC|nr:PLP-dependent aminotransferase family protein [Rhodoblastus acidophilus]PPQ37817.1 PLP-dependent aminotransferase family protein [Rhodoblastus acidophilus]RAI17215.1 PLP-dependent aminotransferase family protein [Rhodoblastus acidophilus]SNB51182.1 transcriptional regulator, GntR family [Rhodoblastus acidophilus]